MKYQVGQQVVFLHEEGGGVIKAVTERAQYIIQDEFGFDRLYSEQDLAPVYNDKFEVDEKVIEERKDPQKEQSKPNRSGNEWQIDLHIEELVDDHSQMSNYEILQLQMRKLRLFVLEAQDRKIRKIIVIHGVGEGVLKHEVVSYLKSVPGSETFDGNYWEYGQGATVALLRYKY